MDNKYVGYIILGIAVLLIGIIFLYSSALKEFVSSSCTLAHGGDTCPMYDTIKRQNYLSFGIVSLLIIISLVLIFSKPQIQERVVVKTKTVREKKKTLDVSGLDEKERKVVELLQKENGGMFQADLMSKLEIGKVGITRLLDKLEAKQIIERKRGGMNNFVVLKG